MYYSDATLARLRHAGVEQPYALAAFWLEQLGAALPLHSAAARRSVGAAAVLLQAPATLAPQWLDWLGDEGQQASAALRRHSDVLSSFGERLLDWSVASAHGMQALSAELLARAGRTTPPAADPSIRLWQSALRMADGSVELCAEVATRHLARSRAGIAAIDPSAGTAAAAAAPAGATLGAGGGGA